MFARRVEPAPGTGRKPMRLALRGPLRTVDIQLASLPGRRLRVPTVEAGVPATEALMRANSSPCGLSDAKRANDTPEFVMAVLLPSGRADSVPDLFVGAMCSLFHDIGGGSQHDRR